MAAAAASEGVADDIRAQNNLQALIRQQIAKVREAITNQKDRAAAIRELRIALIASRREEDALRQQQKEDAAESVHPRSKRARRVWSLTSSWRTSTRTTPARWRSGSGGSRS